METLHAIEPERLTAAANAVTEQFDIFAFQPVLDGTHMSEQPWQREVLGASVPLLIGTTTHESISLGLRWWICSSSGLLADRRHHDGGRACETSGRGPRGPRAHRHDHRGDRSPMVLLRAQPPRPRVPPPRRGLPERILGKPRLLIPPGLSRALRRRPWGDHDALGEVVSGQHAGRAVDTVSPQKVRKKFSRGQEKSSTANDDKYAFAQVRAIFTSKNQQWSVRARAGRERSASTCESARLRRSRKPDASKISPRPASDWPDEVRARRRWNAAPLSYGHAGTAEIR